jgi:putative ABC transport system substrate-binding protein
MMTRRLGRARTRIGPCVLATVLVLPVIIAPFTAETQTATSTRRIGVFAPGSASGTDQFQQLVKAFRQGLRDLGWVEGQTVAIKTRWGEGRLADFPRIVSELVALPVDVLVTWGPQAIGAAQQATSTVPIVMAIAHEPVAFGFVKSLARPGGNITGQAFQDSDLATKRLELLKDVVPRMRHVALLWDPSGGGEAGVRTAEAAAKKLGLTTRILEVRRPEEFGPAFAAARKEGAHAVVQIASPFLATYRARLIELAAANRLPMTCETRLFVVEGCLTAYGPDFVEMSYRAAAFADKILKGAKPADLPVEQPTKFEFAINLGTAKAIGLTIRQSVLVRANDIIQ